MIKCFDDVSVKVVVGLLGLLLFYYYFFEYFFYYFYVDDDFGVCVELIEDFFGIGYGVLLEVSGNLVGYYYFEWFSWIDVVDSVIRVMVGIKFFLV